jgi:hypothetical protein
MRRMPFYFEPWTTWRDTTWNMGFKSGPPQVDDEEVIAKWGASRDRAEAQAKVVLFGSALYDPGVTYPLMGDPQVHDGSGFVATVHPVHSDHPKAADHVQVADRIAECVNACAGLPSPAKTLAVVRSLLADLLAGYVDGEDDRVIRCLDGLTPSEDYLKAQKRIFGDTDECD